MCNLPNDVQNHWKHPHDCQLGVILSSVSRTDMYVLSPETSWAIVFPAQSSDPRECQHVSFTLTFTCEVLALWHTLYPTSSGSVVTQECVEKLIKKDMIDPVTGDKLSDKDIIPLQRVCGYFCVFSVCKLHVNLQCWRSVVCSDRVEQASLRQGWNSEPKRLVQWCKCEAAHTVSILILYMYNLTVVLWTVMPWCSFVTDLF